MRFQAERMELHLTIIVTDTKANPPSCKVAFALVSLSQNLQHIPYANSN
ncbi:hypothetical protein LN893_02215 [Pontibacter sp. XAAS-A31]|nr:hypothetical protein [Pontibacter harenae]